MNKREEKVKSAGTRETEEKTEREEDNTHHNHIAGYPVKEIAKAPVKPPDPNRQYDKKPRELISEATQDESHRPRTKNKIFVTNGIIFIITGLMLGLILDIFITMTLLIIGLVLTFIGTFIKL